MSVPSSPRTSPTVKPLATSPRVKRDWEVRLSVFQVVVLGGVVLGCMASSFYLGLISGQKAGFESAQLVRLSSGVKLPIPAALSGENTEEDLASDVYAKLRTPPPLKIDEQAALGSNTLPKLETIKGADGELLPAITEDSDKHDLSPAEKEVAQKALTGKETNAADHSVGKIIGDLSDNALQVASAKNSSALANTKREAVVNGKGVLSTVAKSSTSKDNTPLGSLSAGQKSLTTNAKIQVDTGKEMDSTARAPLAPAVQEEVIKVDLTKKTPKVLASKDAEAEVVKAPTAPQAEAPKSLLKGTPPLVREVLPRGWFAQVAAPRQLADAQSLAEKLGKSGFPVIVQEANVRGQVYFRVMVGPEDTRPQSERLISQLKRENYLRGEPFLRLVK